MLRGRIAPRHHTSRSYRSPQKTTRLGGGLHIGRNGISRGSQSRESPKIAAFARAFLAMGELVPIFGPSGRLPRNRNGENHHATRPSSTHHARITPAPCPRKSLPPRSRLAAWQKGQKAHHSQCRVVQRKAQEAWSAPRPHHRSLP